MADFTHELYEIFDKCGLNASNLLTSNQNMLKTVSSVRLKLASELNAYVAQQLAKEGEAVPK